MTRIENIIHAGVKAAVKDLFDADLNEGQIQVQKTRKDFVGDVTVVVFPFVKLARKSPEETGKLVGEKLLETDEVVGFNVVKGFLNLEISNTYWISFFAESLKNDKFGFSPAGSKEQVMVEYSSPNTNKPLHLGHMRNNFLGYSVARILEADGHDVVKVQIINDRGIHICKSMIAWQRFADGATPESTGTKGDHFVGAWYVRFDQEYKKQIAELVEGGMGQDKAEKEAEILLAARDLLKRWEDGDAEAVDLWKTMNGWVYDGFDTTYAEMGVDFDKLYYESNTYLLGKDHVLSGLENGILFQKDDGSIWCNLTGDGLDEKILLRSDGTAVYMTQDVGTAILRFADYPALQRQVYTVGNEQEYHFRVLFLILEKLGFEKAKNNFHLSYGMVELPEGKMKSREGTVVDADDLLKEMANTAKEITDELGKLDGVPEEEKEQLYKTLGYGAIKYFLLKVDPRKSMMFDPKESVDFNGNTAPYIQYNYVRTRALLRKSGELGSIDPSVELGDAERELIKSIYRFPEVIAEAAKGYDPSHVANYCFDLVRQYSSFYQANPVLKEENEALRNLRLALSKKTGDILELGMGLLGINMPERM